MMINKKTHGVCIAIILAIAATVRADSVLIIGDGDATNTEAAKSVLLADGHTSVTIDPTFLSSFDGTGLTGYNSVVLLDDGAGVGYPIPTAGQDALVSFVNNGGGLITSEWVDYDAYNGEDSDLEPILPMRSDTYPHTDYVSSITYSQANADPTVDAGLPNNFTFTPDNDQGTDTAYFGKPGAIDFFNDSASGQAGVLGWDDPTGSGRVISFDTLIAGEFSDPSDETEMNDPNYSRLFSNSVFWSEKLSPPPAPLPASVYGGAGLIGLLLLARRLRSRRAAD